MIMTIQAPLFVGVGRADRTLGFILGFTLCFYHIVHITAHGSASQFLCVLPAFQCLLQYWGKGQDFATVWQQFGNISTIFPARVPLPQVPTPMLCGLKH